MAERRFLVVRLGSLGDIVHTFPAVAALRRSFPGAAIVWLTHPRWAELVWSSGLPTEVWEVDSRELRSVRTTLRKVREAKWDAAIDYQGLWKSALLPFLGGVRRRIGFSAESIREYGVPVLYTERVRATAAHVAEQNGELSVRAGAAMPIAEAKLKVSEAATAKVRGWLTAEGIERYAVVSPGGGWRSKCWPAERYGALAREIEGELGLRCVLNYGPGEEGLLDEVRAAAGNARLAAYCGTLAELMAVLSGAECVVGGDTGPLQLAGALGTPYVALFGPTDPARNGPYPPEGVVLRAPSVESTYKRHTETHPSLLALRVEDVMTAVRREARGAA